jgi:hypothetical protein
MSNAKVLGRYFITMVAIADSGVVTSLQWWLSPIAGSLLCYIVAIPDSFIVTSLLSNYRQ